MYVNRARLGRKVKRLVYTEIAPRWYLSNTRFPLFVNE